MIDYSYEFPVEKYKVFQVSRSGY